MTFVNEPSAGAGGSASQPDPRSTVRIGDKERQEAMDLLSKHVEAGRLDISEYDDRCRKAANARVHSELSELFADLPRIPRQEEPKAELAVPGYGQEVYTAAEIDVVRRKGRNVRAGVMLFSVMAGLALTEVSDWFMWIIPIMAVLLYVIKVGPKSWYMPSSQELRREELRNQRKAMRQQRRLER